MNSMDVLIESLCLYELHVRASSKLEQMKKIYHKIHICDLCDPRELYGYGCSNYMLVKKIFRKIHIYGDFFC